MCKDYVLIKGYPGTGKFSLCILSEYRLSNYKRLGSADNVWYVPVKAIKYSIWKQTASDPE